MTTNSAEVIAKEVLESRNNDFNSAANLQKVVKMSGSVYPFLPSNIRGTDKSADRHWSASASAGTQCWFVGYQWKTLVSSVPVQSCWHPLDLSDPLLMRVPLAHDDFNEYCRTASTREPPIAAGFHRCSMCSSCSHYEVVEEYVQLAFNSSNIEQCAGSQGSDGLVFILSSNFWMFTGLHWIPVEFGGELRHYPADADGDWQGLARPLVHNAIQRPSMATDNQWWPPAAANELSSGGYITPPSFCLSCTHPDYLSEEPFPKA
ncbi:hypothetical protein FB451DRAFT_1194557 [Mycena latifolia]|nr:hypothetical protein FB451DRAFT_1194557 [Mycena latifolia]